MMSSEQLKAFDVSQEPAAVRAEYGDTPFGRGCLAARRLIEVGVRCVEVTLDGWDTHVNNHEIHRRARQGCSTRRSPPCCATWRAGTCSIGPSSCAAASSAGRPRSTSPAAATTGPSGFSLALAGGGIRGGLAIGETDPEGVKDPVRPTTIEDVHATVLTALGLNPAKENIAPATGRPIKLSAGPADPRAAGVSGLAIQRNKGEGPYERPNR